MESGDINDNQITSSSGESQEGRLNNNDYWEVELGADLWIQVSMSQQTLVTGIITQGGPDTTYEDWVRNLQIQYGDTENTLMYISENGQPKVSTHVSNSFLYIHIKPHLSRSSPMLMANCYGYPISHLQLF